MRALVITRKRRISYVVCMFIPIGIEYRRTGWRTATLALVVFNVAVYILQPLLPVDELMLWPDRLSPWQWLTSVFLHADLWHLAGNMIFLATFGVYIEARVGWWRMLVLYLVGGLVASGFFWFAEFGGDVPALGASGAITALMGMCLVAAPFGKVRVAFMHPVQLVTFMRPGGRKSWFLALPLFALVVLWTLEQVLYAWGGVEGVAYFAHLGGLVSGLLLGLALKAKVLPWGFEFEGPGTKEEIDREKRERFAATVAAGYAATAQESAKKVDYMKARKPRWDDDNEMPVFDLLSHDDD